MLGEDKTNNKQTKNTTKTEQDKTKIVSCWSSRAMVNLQEPGKLEENDETHKDKEKANKQKTGNHEKTEKERREKLTSLS